MYNNLALFTFADIEKLFPFNFLLNEDLQIVHYGPALAKVFGTSQKIPFSSVFDIKKNTDGLALNFETLKKRTHQLFIVEFQQFESVFLQGELRLNHNTNEIIFLGNIWMADTGMLKKMNLSFSDFSFTSALPDMMVTLDTIRSTNAELKNLANELYRNQQELEEKSYIADKIIHPLLLLDVSGNILWANSSFLISIGLTLQATTGKPFIQLIQSSIIEKHLINVIDTAIKNGNEIKLELSFRQPLQEDRWVEMEMQPILNAKKAIEKFIVVLKNITAEKNYKSSLQKSEEKYKNIVDNVSDIIFQTDAKGNWTFLNHAWESIMKFTLSESLNTPFFNYLHKEDVEKNAKLFAPLIEQKKDHCEHAIRYISKDGKIKWMRVFAKLLFLENGEVAGTFGTLQDITNEMQLEHTYDVILKNINDVVCILTTSGEIKFLSPSFQALTGHEAADVPQIAEQYMHQQDRYISGQKLKELIQAPKGKVITVDFRLQFDNGTYRWFEATGKKIYDEFYLEDLLMITLRDIDERKRAELLMLESLKKEKELNELKSEFVQITSHEFRNPLAVIQSSAELMDYYMELQQGLQHQTETFKNHIVSIKTETSRLSYLVEEILMFGKIDQGQITPKYSMVNLENTARLVICRNSNKFFDDRQMNICIIGATKLVNTDSKLMEHILDNLVNNAFKYSPNCPNPILSIAFADGYFEIIIQDFGMGIPLEDRESIFTPFHRGNNVDLIRGNGIGLSIAFKFVQLLGGRIHFESELAVGTKFFIQFGY